MDVQLEICIDSIESAVAAREGGADRLEVCSSLASGGTTPSEGLLRCCLDQVGLPVMMMIRPRDGDFVYGPADLTVMLRDIEAAQRLGVAGVVLGALTPDRQIDQEACRQLLRAAAGLKATFHRAFDVADDPLVAFDQIIDLGFDCLLTSGQQRTAAAGTALIAQLQRRAAGRLVVMAGAGVTAENAHQVVEATGVSYLHASASRPVSDVVGSQFVSDVQFGQPRRLTYAADVRAIRRACTRSRP